jgi:hypothetical protein
VFVLEWCKMSTVAGGWSPILEGEDRAQARRAIRDLTARALEKTDPRDHSLASGTTGVSILLTALGRYAEAEHAITSAFEVSASGEPTASLYGGMAGIGWAANYYASAAARAPADDPRPMIDAALVDLLADWTWNGDFDLIYGLVGVGIYGLARGRDSGDAIVELVVERLAEGVATRAPGLTWHTPPEQLVAEQLAEAPSGYDNLGVAHGVPAVISFVAQAAAADIRTDEAARLATGAVSWLRAQRLGPDSPSAYPFWVAAGIQPVAARTAWCYGDPGIAAALMVAASSAGRHDWQQDAVELAERAAVRPAQTTGVEDASLCHGAAGLGHLFNRFHQATGSPRCGEAARTWFRVATDLADQSEEGPGFLVGDAGVALALSSAAGDTAPGWDAVLAISRARP